MFDLLKEDLNKQYVKHNALLTQLCVIDESIRKSPIYQDPKHFPFYYHLGKCIQPKKLLEIGVGIGFCSSCFFKTCQTVNDYIAMQYKSEDYYSPRLAIKNIRSNYKNNISFYSGDISNEKFISTLANTDLIFYNEKRKYNEMRFDLDLLWDQLKSDGFMVIGYYNNENNQVIKDFLKIKNKVAEEFQTRYGTVIIRK